MLNKSESEEEYRNVKPERYIEALEFFMEHPEACTDELISAFVKGLKKRIEERQKFGQKKLN